MQGKRTPGESQVCLFREALWRTFWLHCQHEHMCDSAKCKSQVPFNMDGLLLMKSQIHVEFINSVYWILQYTLHRLWNTSCQLYYSHFPSFSSLGNWGNWQRYLLLSLHFELVSHAMFTCQFSMNCYCHSVKSLLGVIFSFSFSQCPMDAKDALKSHHLLHFWASVPSLQMATANSSLAGLPYLHSMSAFSCAMNNFSSASLYLSSLYYHLSNMLQTIL